jgi:hypothetical protein
VYTSTHSVYVFRTILKINSDFCPMQHSSTGLSKGRTLYSLRGAQCTFGRNVHNAKLEVLTEVLMKNQIFYDVRLCYLLTRCNILEDLNLLMYKYSGFGGPEVACWPFVPVGFLGRKTPQNAFLRRGSKAVGPMSLTLRHVKEPKSEVEVATFGKILGHFSPKIPPSATRERSNHWSSKLGV